jgi:hypothetical protein
MGSAQRRGRPGRRLRAANFWPLFVDEHSQVVELPSAVPVSLRLSLGEKERETANVAPMWKLVLCC